MVMPPGLVLLLFVGLAVPIAWCALVDLPYPLSERLRLPILVRLAAVYKVR